MAKPSLNYYQAVHVGKVKTDVIQFTTIQAAIDAIADNATDKRYAVYVHPGSYSEVVVMEDFVDLIAIGGREETIITRTCTANDQITVTGENSMIKGFTIISIGNVAGSFRTRCVSNAVDGFEMEDCVLIATGPAAAAVTFIAIASCDIRNSLIDWAAASATGLSVDINTKDYNVDDCKISGAINAVLVTNPASLNITRSTLGNTLNMDNGSSVTIRDSMLETIDLDGGTLTLAQVYVGSISADTGGSITAYGGTIRQCTSATVSFVWWEDDNHLKVIANMKIAHALALAGVGDVITVYPGTYAENNLNLKASVDLVGTDPDQCLIVVASANPILNAGVTCSISNLTVGNGGAGTAITVTANILTVRNCYLYGTADNAIAMTAGTLIAYDTRVGVGDIDLSTAPCTLTMYRCQITTDPVDTAATAFAHAMTFEQCDFGGQNITSLATVATTLALRGCTNVNAITNAGTGAFTIRDSDVVSINNTATGTFTIYGGYVGSITRGAASVVWWKHSNELCVLPSATTTDPMIASALAAASSGDVIKLTQGTFAESLTARSRVNIIGEGWGLSIIETTNNGAPIIAVGDNITCEIHGVKISNLGAGGAIHVEPVANASALVLEDCLVSNAGASDCVVVTSGGAGSGTLTARRCDFDSDAANSIVVLAGAGGGLLYFNSWDCQFGLCGGAANAAIEASATVVADVNVTRAVFTATCARALYCTGAIHTVDIEDSEFNGADVELAGNLPIVNLTKCNNVGAFAHSVACTVTLRDCYLSDTYTIAAVAGVVNAYRTQFSAFTNGGTGTIAFQECNGTNINNNDISVMTIEGGHWDTVLQAAAGGTINIYEAVIATEFDCSAGGAINAYNCQVADLDSNGGTITLYEGDLRLISTAIVGVVVWWEAPHQLRVISSTANMKIMDAADAAAAGDTILIGPGTFTEALDLDAAINACTYKGFGRDRTIITQPTGTTVLVDGITSVVLEDLRIELTAGVDTNAALKLDAATNASASVILRNVAITTTRAAGTVYGVWAIDDGAKVGLVLIYDSTITCSGGANSYAVAANPCTTVTSLISLYDSIIYGQTYDIYNDRITITTHKCELNGAGWYIASNASAIGLAMDNEDPGTVTPVTFAGAAGEFADLTGAELYTCLAGVLVGMPVYVSVAANTVVAATNVAATPVPTEGIVVYKPGGAGAVTCYVKNSGMFYMASPPVVWAAGTNVWLGVAGVTLGQAIVRPTNALKQVLGVGVEAKRLLINIAPVEVATEWMNIPLAWGAGSAPIGTHTDGNSRRAVAIATAAQTVFSQAVDIPEDFLTFLKLYARLFPTVPTLTAMASAQAYNVDGAPFTDETVPSNNVGPNDMTLLPAAPAENDAYYFGAARRFSQFDINIGTAGVKAPGAWTLAWEYSKGAGVWAALTGVIDGTVEFTAAPGVHTVSFVVPSDWAADTVNAVLAYYIRARVSAPTTIPIGVQPLGTQSWTNDGTYDWTAYSSAASDDEDEATHSDWDTANGVPTTEDLIEDLDISGAANGYTMVEKDCFSIELIIDALMNTTQVLVLGFRLEYSTQRGA